MALLLALVAIVLTLVFLFYWNELQFWKRRGIPGPDGRIFIGNYWQMLNPKYCFPLVLRDWTKKYGKVYGVQEGIRKFLVVSDVDMLQEMFIKKFDYFYGRKISANFQIVRDTENDPTIHLFESQGIRWKRLRTISAPSFSANGLKKIRSKVEETALELVRLLDLEADNGHLNIHSYFQEFTMDAISKIAMGQKESTFFDNYRSRCIQQLFGRDMRNPFFVMCSVAPAFHTKIRVLFDIVAQIMKGPSAQLFNGIYRAVDERIAERQRMEREGEEIGEAEDFIDLFLEARSEEEDVNKGAEYSRAEAKVSRHLTREEIVAQCFVFLLAGFDTTANSLAYTSWLLSQNPEKQRRLQEEIEQVCGLEQEISYESLSKLKYMESCMKETLRMFPLASFAASRQCMKETTLGELRIEKGTYVLADTWSIHYDKELWGADADEFVPERWEKPETRHQMAWFPFGAGPRLCIGMRLAYMEEKLALCHLLRRFDIVAGEKTEKTLKLKGSSIVAPERVTVYLKRRE